MKMEHCALVSHDFNQWYIIGPFLASYKYISYVQYFISNHIFNNAYVHVYILIYNVSNKAVTDVW